ncbi:MAG: phosphate ABC transporter, partial [Rhodocyclaceae bacterium]|nr:phosphate ABC transporter [Rhodocyclaceae bacterium]
RSRVEAAFLDLAATESGRVLLREVPMLEVVPTSMKEYQPMRAWGLEAFWVD